MPLPRTLARWNKAGLNRVTKHVAPWVPGFGVVTHAGRRSGRRYQTPVNVFPAGDSYLLALTYGPDSDWVKNVRAAGGCELVTRGRTVRLVSPQLVHDENRRGIRPVERQVLRLIGVADFLSLKTAPAAGANSARTAAADSRRAQRYPILWDDSGSSTSTILLPQMTRIPL